jgi:hypothetical protein
MLQVKMVAMAVQELLLLLLAHPELMLVAEVEVVVIYRNHGLQLHLGYKNLKIHIPLEMCFLILAWLCILLYLCL